MNTFLKNIAGFSDTIMIFEDEAGYKFGAVSCEEWSPSKEFFGNGENFVFTFKAIDKISTFVASNDNSMYQFTDRTCIGVGGGYGNDRFAIYLGEDLYQGSSAETGCFKNEVLSKNGEFLCMDIEVWTFD